jgi:Coenzyme PQQ synthesis protein D (PqqD)
LEITVQQKETVKPKRLDVFSREVMDELLIYDERTHLGHCLNWTAAAVWRACDGERTIADITRHLQAQVNPDIDEQTVRITLSKLKSAGLLLDENIPAEGETLSRREVMRRIGTITALALPVVTTMLMPTPARAASCFPPVHACNANTQCCSGHCGVNLLCL